MDPAQAAALASRASASGGFGAGSNGSGSSPYDQHLRGPSSVYAGAQLQADGDTLHYYYHNNSLYASRGTTLLL